MRKIFLCSILVAWSVLPTMLKAQKTYKVVYKLAGAQSGWGQLLVGEKETYYYRLKEKETPPEINKTEKIMGFDAPQPMVERNASNAQNTRVVYHRENKKALRYVEHITDNYFSVLDDLQIDWRILPKETRKIGGYNCQKAQAHVRGRDYEAWFTPDIAVSSGPWKLYGLPGLILEATSTDGKYQFLFEKIETSDLPTKGFDFVFKEPFLTYSQFLIEVDKYQQQQANKLHKKAQSGWTSVFSDAKTTGMTLKTNNIEKTLEKTYTADVPK
ncbi:MAG: GLPGLI family protein [Runella sp.]